MSSSESSSSSPLAPAPAKMTNLNGSDVVIEIEKRLNQTKPSKRSKWCIYRVPNDIRKVNKDAYTPKEVSIGPFHYGNNRLQNMQTHKWEYFKKFVERSGANLDDLASFVGKLESRVRSCYAENIVYHKNQLVKIIMLDACFIIELFWRFCDENCSRDDALLPGFKLSSTVKMDLLLLENQLPFFVLKKLFNWAFPSSPHSFLELTFRYFFFLNEQGFKPDGVTVCHFTDLLRYFYLQPARVQPDRIEEREVLNLTATKLQEAGLKFKVNNESRCLLGLKLKGHVLEIPKIFLYDRFEVEFRNMVALEQCHYPSHSYIYDYVSILDFLIDTDKDVDVLVQEGIIINRTDDSKGVAKMINGLGRNVTWCTFNSDYNQLCKNLNEFCTNPCRKLTATLKRDYCKTPWQTAASIAGVLLLFLTLLQTIFSGIQVMQQYMNA